MSLSMVIFTFINAWWISLFVVLPWGVSVPENPPEGHASGAPERPHIKKKLLATTLLAFIVTAALALVINSGIVSLREDDSMTGLLDNSVTIISSLSH